MATAKITKLTFGVLFNHSFSLLDAWGKIVDNLLYKNSYFNPDYFPRISDQYTVNRFLENPEKGHLFQLNAENIIYTHNVQKNYEVEYEQFITSISKYIIPEIIQKQELTVRRIGMVYTCEMDKEAITSFTAQYFKPEIAEVIDCRFSKRETISESLLFSGIDNYINKIYSVGNLGNESNGISYDYQLFFNPPIVDLKHQITKFFNNAKTDFYKEIYKEEYRGE